eukprot:886454-Pyramimonas_sp.AAC.1
MRQAVRLHVQNTHPLALASALVHCVDGKLNLAPVVTRSALGRHVADPLWHRRASTMKGHEHQRLTHC